jgi:hypothetical protein
MKGKQIRKLWPFLLLLAVMYICVFGAIPSGLHAQGGHNVTLSWTAGTGTGTPATGYNVKRGTAPGIEVTIGTTTAPTTTYVDTTGTGGIKYYYVVTGTAIGAPESAPTNEVSAIFLPIPQVQTPGALGAVAN